MKTVFRFLLFALIAFAAAVIFMLLTMRQAEGQDAPRPRLEAGAWWTPLTPPRLAFSWGLGSNAADYEATLALAEKLDLNAVMFPTPSVADGLRLRLPAGIDWYGVQMGTDGEAAAMRAFTADPGADDCRFRFALLYGEGKPLGEKYGRVRETLLRRAPWVLVADGPLGWDGGNAARISQAALVLSFMNVSRGFAEDVVWYAALHRRHLPGVPFGISPQLVIGAANAPGDSGEIAAAIRLLAPRAEYLPLWGVHHAARALPSDAWIAEVRAAARAWRDWRPGDEPPRPSIGISASIKQVYWQRALCRIAHYAGFEPDIADATDARLAFMDPTRPGPGATHWSTLQGFNEGTIPAAHVKLLEIALAQILKGAP